MHPGRSDLRWAAIVLTNFVLLASPAEAQDPPVNAARVAQWIDPSFLGAYADIWADGDFVYLAHFGDAGVHIVDISDPANPTLATHYRLPEPNTTASAQDVKVGDGLMFVALEGTFNNSIHVADVRNPAAPVPLVDISITGFNLIHNVFYHAGFLYFADSSSTRVGIVDLRSLDPDNPPASPITETQWILEGVGNSFVHDVTALGDRLYVAAWDYGLFIYDIADVALSQPGLLGSIDGENTHSCWPTADGRFVVTGEERSGGGIQVFEVTENGGSISLTLRDSLELTTTGQAFSVHNQVVVGNRLFNSWYQAGLQVFDIDPDSGSLQFVASFDTSASSDTGFTDGNWGVYPFLGPDKICLSDMDNGLFIVNIGAFVKIGFPAGVPRIISSSAPTRFDVRITGNNDTVLSESPTLHYRYDGGSFLSTSLVSRGGDLYEATLPAGACGDLPEFYVSAAGAASGVLTEPVDAPVSVFKAPVGEFVVPAGTFTDDFEADRGWTVTTSGFGADVDGSWERDVPIDENFGDPPADFDGSGQCYVTDNSSAFADVHSGTTTLTSPPFDAAGCRWITYAYWLNDVPLFFPLTPGDSLTVQVATDPGGTNWKTVRTYTTPLSEWRTDAIEIGVEVPASTTVRIRFAATDRDVPIRSILEAGVDAVRVVELNCGDETLCCASGFVGDADGDGVCDNLDNCLLAANPEQEDGDNNGLGDACDSLLTLGDCPNDVLIQATSQGGAIVDFPIPPADEGFGNVTVIANPPSGALFPVGTTLVTVAAADDSGKTVTCSFNITVLAPPAPAPPSDPSPTSPSPSTPVQAPGPPTAAEDSCGCGSGMDGLMVLPMTLAGIGLMRRRRADRRFRR